MHRTRHTSTLLFALAVAGCAALGGGGGGGDNLPNRGIVPYERVTPAEGDSAHFALHSATPSTRIYVEPHAMELQDGRLTLFAEARDPASGAGELVRCELDDDLTCGEPRVILSPDEAWMEGRVGAPTVLRQETSWLLGFAYGSGAGIGLAWSIDGETFSADTSTLLQASGPFESQGIDSPSLIRTETGYRLYYAGRDADGISRVLVADGDHALGFERVGIALGPGLACEDVAGQPESCWDALGIDAPEVRVAVTGAGRTIYRLFYTGLGASGGSLGFAASWDGLDFSRFVYNPVVATESYERQPTNLWAGDRYLLFFEERVSNTERGIAVSVNDAPAASEVF